MKKVFLFILAFTYLTVTSGVALNIHYCMNKIASVDLMHASDKCGKCGMKNGANDCCKDEFKILKLSDSHKLIGNEINIFTPVAIIQNLKSSFDVDIFTSLIIADLKNNSPPFSQQISLNILYGVFRI